MVIKKPIIIAMAALTMGTASLPLISYATSPVICAASEQTDEYKTQLGFPFQYTQKKENGKIFYYSSCNMQYNTSTADIRSKYTIKRPKKKAEISSVSITNTSSKTLLNKSISENKKQVQISVRPADTAKGEVQSDLYGTNIVKIYWSDGTTDVINVNIKQYIPTYKLNAFVETNSKSLPAFKYINFQRKNGTKECTIKKIVYDNNITCTNKTTVDEKKKHPVVAAFDSANKKVTITAQQSDTAKTTKVKIYWSDGTIQLAAVKTTASKINTTQKKANISSAGKSDTIKLYSSKKRIVRAWSSSPNLKLTYGYWSDQSNEDKLNNRYGYVNVTNEKAVPGKYTVSVLYSDGTTEKFNNILFEKSYTSLPKTSCTINSNTTNNTVTMTRNGATITSYSVSNKSIVTISQSNDKKTLTIKANKNTSGTTDVTVKYSDYKQETKTITIQKGYALISTNDAVKLNSTITKSYNVPIDKDSVFTTDDNLNVSLSSDRKTITIKAIGEGRTSVYYDLEDGHQYKHEFSVYKEKTPDQKWQEYFNNGQIGIERDSRGRVQCNGLGVPKSFRYYIDSDYVYFEKSSQYPTGYISRADFARLCNCTAWEYGGNPDMFERAKVVETIINICNQQGFTIKECIHSNNRFEGSPNYYDLTDFNYNVTNGVKDSVALYLTKPSLFNQGYNCFFGDGQYNYFWDNYSCWQAAWNGCWEMTYTRHDGSKFMIHSKQDYLDRFYGQNVLEPGNC